MISNKIIISIAIILYIVSRLYIISYPAYKESNPHGTYSDVKHDYERYANMWYYGLTPYLKHYYEYPPATIPLLLTPLILDQHGIGKYYANYRTGIMIIDTILFVFILAALFRLNTSRVSKALALGFFIIAPMVAKDFFYEGIDLAFIAALSIALISVVLFKHTTLIHRTFFWMFFWLSTAIKFMSLPLLVPFFWLKQQSLKKEILACFIGFLLIWGIPLAIFRSSLSVSVVFHFNRHMKYASFPAYIVETVDKFTHTETKFDEPPDFPLLGPVQTIVEKVDGVVFPLSILAVLVYAVWVITKPNKIPDFKILIRRLLLLEKINLSGIDIYSFSIKIALMYIFTLFLTGKIFSQPFHIWYIPLLTLYPFKNPKQQLVFYGLALWMLVRDTTGWIKVDEQLVVMQPLTLKFFWYLVRFLPMAIMLYLSCKLPNNERSLKTS